MTTATLKVDGLDVIRRALLELPDRLATNSLASAVNAGAAVIRDEARALAPEYTGPVSKGHPPPGTLRRSIIVKSIRELSTYYRKVSYVTVRHGKKYQDVGKRHANLDAYYWRFIEFWTTHAAARPFLRPAFESLKYQAVQTIKDGIAQGVEEEATKLGQGAR